MTCVKTGCSAYIEPTNQYLHGDLFFIFGAYIFRVVKADSNRPPRLHLKINNYENWWDREAYVSTLAFKMTHATHYGYDGIPTEDAL